MKQSGHLNHSEKTGTGCPVTSKYGMTPPSKHVCGQQLQQNRRTFTKNKKADWTQFTEDTEFAFSQTTIPTNIHTANRIFKNIIMMADKQNTPKGKMHSYCRLLPDHIVWKITQRNNMRRADTCGPALRLLNEEITSDRHTHT